ARAGATGAATAVVTVTVETATGLRAATGAVVVTAGERTAAAAAGAAPALDTAEGGSGPGGARLRRGPGGRWVLQP
ncbi:hypothetical protein, partial [Streptomyces sp. BE303]|uniref:hypothetical protein n=1 Tax=Streptomyces sp. BE303 TaxID=3002528 RepID=UPI002E784303